MTTLMQPPDPEEELQNRLRKFLEDDPLYRALEIPGGITGYDEWPRRVTVWCSVDSGPRPFRRMDQSSYSSDMVDLGFSTLEFKCGECDEFVSQYYLLGSNQGEDDDQVGYIRKIGQYPPFDIQTPSNMRKFLGTSEPIYKNALISLSVGFGIGALAYMRRVVENKARDILLLLAAIQEAEGASADDVKAVRKLAEGRLVEPILKRAAELLPDHLKLKGKKNPIELIYDNASGEIHAGTEDDAIDKAMAIRVALEYVMPPLQRQIEGRQEYLDAMSKLDEGS